VAPGEFTKYDLPGRAAQRHRTEIRSFFGFREVSEEYQSELARWLADELCGVEFDRGRLAVAVVARCRAERVEPPAPRQIDRLVASAVRAFEHGFCLRTMEALSAESIVRLEQLITEPAEHGDTEADRRALSPLFWTHFNPYGRFELDMNRHLDLGSGNQPGTQPEPPADASPG